jgi:protoporphyrinogen IX oxidase
MLYLVLKSLHIIAVIAWMAGMLYLPRLYVYHADAKPGSPQSETFKMMERRLLRAIINPAMAATWILGIGIAYMQGYWLQGWFILKLVLVLAMSGVHGAFSAWRKDFEADRNTRPARFYRIWNEVPTLLMIAIVFVVVIKPF